MVNVELQFVYATSSRIGNQLLLTLASSKVLLGQGSEKTFNGWLRANNAFSSVALVQIWVLRLIAAKQKYALNVLSKLFTVSEFSAG